MINFLKKLIGNRDFRSGLSGQSMLEVIVASGVIVTAVSAALTLVQSSINGAKASEEKIVAFNLAREGLEAVRLIRDSNWLAGRDFDEGLWAPPFDYIGQPAFDPTTKTWSIFFESSDWESDGTRVYRQDFPVGLAQPGMYLQALAQPDGTEVTRFRRRLHLKRLCSTAVGSDENFIASYSQSDGLDCNPGDEKIGIEANVYIHWDQADGTYHEVHLIERLFNWR
jgi:type II secretory pathway pseudopilin PulG